MANPDWKVHALEGEWEFRFQVGSEIAILQVQQGMAELFGAELAIGEYYAFRRGARIAVFTWLGCTLLLKGEFECSIGKNTPMMHYLQCHAVLEDWRLKVTCDCVVKRGPIVMVVGPSDAGKSTVCRHLVNLAIRADRNPIFVDLDVSQGGVGIPGTIGALRAEKPAGIDERYSEQSSMVFNFGHVYIKQNLKLLELLVNRLSEAVCRRLRVDMDANTSGVIVNTGSFKKERYALLTHAIQAFQVDMIVVLGQEFLYKRLSQDMPEFVRITLIPKSDGVIGRDGAFRAAARRERLKEYFYGDKIPRYPYSFDVKWSDIKIFQVIVTELTPVEPGPHLLHHLMAVNRADPSERDIMVLCNTAAYICVTNVDEEAQTFSMLSTEPGPLPNNVVILSEILFKGIK